MPLLSDLFVSFLDGLTGHLALVVYLLAVTGERTVWRRLKKLPPLLLSPLAAVLLTVGLNAVPELETFQYFIFSFAILVMCTVGCGGHGSSDSGGPLPPPVWPASFR